MTFTDRVYRLLINMSPGEIKLLSTIDFSLFPDGTEDEHKKRFIAEVKEFIHHDTGSHFGFGIEFNNSYTSVKKLPITVPLTTDALKQCWAEITK